MLLSVEYNACKPHKSGKLTDKQTDRQTTGGGAMACRSVRLQIPGA